MSAQPERKKYKVDLQFMGKTVYSIETVPMTPEEVEAEKQRVLGEYKKNRFTKNLALELVVSDLE